MKFCNVCHNVKFISTNDDKNLVYFCSVCGDKEVADTQKGSVCVIEDNKVDDEILYSQYINKYIKFDPSLPRVNNIVCRNPECKRPPNVEPETIYLKYDHINMQYLYYCCHCDFFWKQDKN